MGNSYDDYIETQDNMRPFRMFVGAAAGMLQAADQTYANEDFYAASLPRQYQTVGVNGVSIEGTPLAITRRGAVVISPVVWMIGLGAAAALLLKR